MSSSVEKLRAEPRQKDPQSDHGPLSSQRANAAISVVRGVLLRPLVNREADRLIYIRQSASGIRLANAAFSVPELRDLQQSVKSLIALRSVLHALGQSAVRLAFDSRGQSARSGQPEELVMRTSVCLLAVALLTVGGSEIASQTGGVASQPIRQIDHIMIRTGTPQELYAFFTETLELPVAWPITSPRAGVVTGGVGFGNVNVEAIQFPGQTDSRPRLVGIAFEPSGLEASLSELNRRGITSGERRPLTAVGADGAKKTLWTNVTLRQFSDADSPANATLHIFLSEYSPSYVNVEERRSRLRQQLFERSGGPLGVVEVKEVIIGATDLEMARRLWQRLLDPARSAASHTWHVGNGPAIRLVSATEDRIQTLVIRVASLDRAKAFLRDKQLLGAESDGHAAIDPPKVGGLDIRLVG